MLELALAKDTSLFEVLRGIPNALLKGHSPAIVPRTRPCVLSLSLPGGTKETLKPGLLRRRGGCADRFAS